MTVASWFELTDRISEVPIAALIIGVILKSAALLLIAWALTIALHRSSASLRHFVWSLGLAGALALPVLSVVMPAWRVALLPARASALSPLPGGPHERAPLADEPHEFAPFPRVAEAQGGASLLGHTASDGDQHVAFATTPVEQGAMPDETVAAGAPHAAHSPELLPVRLFTSLRPAFALAVIWFAGFLVALFPLMRGRRAVRIVARNARVVTQGNWHRISLDTMRELTFRRSVTILESDASPMPMTWGVLRPVVLLPAGELGWNDGQRRAALRHELAHVKRHDCLTQLIARLACAVYWFNPLSWLAARRLRIERELACDDDVLSSGTRASEYAAQLLAVARTLAPAPTTAAAALSMARPSQMGSRLRAILDGSRSRARLGVRRALAAGGTALGVVTVLAAFAPVPKSFARAHASPELIVAGRSPEATAAALPRRGADAGRATGGGPMAKPAVTGAQLPGIAALASMALPDEYPAATEQERQDSCDSVKRGQKGSHTNMTRSENNGASRTWEVRWKYGRCVFDLDARGALTFNADATDLQSISRGGHFELERRDGDETRRIRITPNDDGSLARVYWVNGAQRPFDAEGTAWLANALVTLDRRTAFAADARLPAILKRGGVPAALEEIARVESSYAQRVYYSKLIALQPLTTAQLRDVLTRVGTFESDYERAQLLLSLTKLSTFTDEAHAEFLTAAAGISSDYEKRRVLGAMLGRADLRPVNVKGLLSAARGMESDYELAELLISVSKRYGMTSETRPLYVEALGSLDSDYEHRRVLMAILKSGEMTPSLIQALLTDGARLDSDYERGQFLLAVAASGALEPPSYDSYFKIVDAMNSDYEQRRVLEVLIKREGTTRDLAERIIRSAATIESDYECSAVLVSVARAIPIDDRLRPSYEKAASTIESEYEYGKAMAALRRRAEL